MFGHKHYFKYSEQYELPVVRIEAMQQDWTFSKAFLKPQSCWRLSFW